MNKKTRNKMIEIEMVRNIGSQKKENNFQMTQASL